MAAMLFSGIRFPEPGKSNQLQGSCSSKISERLRGVESCFLHCPATQRNSMLSNRVLATTLQSNLYVVHCDYAELKTKVILLTGARGHFLGSGSKARASLSGYCTLGDE